MNPRGVSKQMAAKTHCLHGHAFDIANTRVYLKDGRVWRVCRKCHARRVHASQRKARV